VDLKAQYENTKAEIDAAIAGVIRDTAFIGGPYLSAFEGQFAKFLGMEHCIGCANGTDSIEILLQSFGIGRDAEVIVPAHTWISTAEAVTTAGARPVFVDTHPDYYTIDPSHIREKITTRTKAIIAVHLYGLMAPMDEILAIAREHSLIVLEDSAQAHAARYKGRYAGTIGHAASFSFFPGKNLGAYGDAGCMLTNDPEIAQKARMIANHGRTGKHDHQMEGRNSRLDGLQAAILSAKLPHLHSWTAARRENARLYDKYLKGLPLKLPVVPPDHEHSYHLYVVQTDARDRIQKSLEEAGIATGIHYPIALPFLKAYSRYGHSIADFPVAHAAMSRILSLPMYPELRENDIERIASIIKDCVD